MFSNIMECIILQFFFFLLHFLHVKEYFLLGKLNTINKVEYNCFYFGPYL